MNRPRGRALTASVVMLVAVGCATSAGSRMANPAPVEHSPADVRFMQHMIPHHAQALVMTDLVPARAGSDRIRMLARRIEVSQQDEIAMIRAWLGERGEDIPDSTARHDHAGMGGDTGLMPGMLTAEQLDRLASSSGTEFDRLFLEYMIRHHQGALTMVSELFASEGAAQDAETYQIASEIGADQATEIARMRAVLDDMVAGARHR